MARNSCMTFLVTSTAISFLIISVSCSNILVVPLVGEGSHYSVMLEISKELLLNRGHNVSMLVSDLFHDKLTSSNKARVHTINYIFFPAELNSAQYKEIFTNMTMAALRGKYVEWFIQTVQKNDSVLQRQYGLWHDLLTNQEVLSTLREANFELSLADFNGNCAISQYLRKTLDIPYIALSAVLVIPFSACIDNRMPFNPAYVPEFTSGLDHAMTFPQRLKNLGTSFLFMVMNKIITVELAEKRINLGLSETSMHCSDADLQFINTNFVLDFPRPILPNTKAVGGLTTKPERPLAMVSSHFMCN